MSHFKYKKLKNGIPKGIRTPVAGMKTRCPRPLDDGDIVYRALIIHSLEKYANEKMIKNKKNIEVSRKDKGMITFFFLKWRKSLIFSGILMVILVAIYSNSTGVPFYFDDEPFILNNSNIHADTLSFSDIVVKPLHGPGRFRALPMISFALNFYFGRLNVYGYHLVNILFHILNTVLLFFLILITLKCSGRISSKEEGGAGIERHLQGKDFPVIAFWAALLWGISPLHTGSVTYIVQRMNLMAMFFSLTALLFYLKGRLLLIGESAIFADSESADKKLMIPVIFFFAAVFAVGCAVFSKENAAILPIVILMYELFFFSRKRRGQEGGAPKRLIFLIIYICAIPGLLFLLSIIWFHKNPIEVIKYSYITRDFTMGERLLTEPRVLWHYISLLIFPLYSRLQLVYDFQLSTSLFSPWTTLPAIAGLVAVAGLLYKYTDKYRLEAFCVVWFFLQSVIESSFVGIEIIYEHRTYMPSAFFFLLLVLVLYRFSRNRKTAYTILAIFAIFSIYSTVERNNLWRTPELFWADNYTKSPEEARVMLNCANALRSSGKSEEAAELYEELIKKKPDDALAYFNYGELLAAEKSYLKAEKLFRKAIDLEKHYSAAYFALGAVCQDRGDFDDAMKYYLKAEKKNPDNPIILTNIASLYREQKKWEQAEKMYKRALTLSPEMLRASLDLGLIYMKDQKYEDALDVYNSALTYHPHNSELYYRLGVISMQEKNYEGALLYFQRALILNPEQKGVRKAIADVNALRGTTENALKSYKEMLEKNPDDYNTHNSIGLLILKTGDITTAEEHFRKAIELKPDFAAALKNMGNIMFIRKEYQQAEKYYLDALKITPRDAVLHHNLGSVYAFRKEFDKAKDSYTKALEINPDYYEAKQNLKRVLKKL